MTHRGAHTCRGMGCSDSRVCSGGLCSRQAAGVLRLDLHSEFFCRHQIVGHGRLVVGWLFVERHARLLVFLIMLTAAPQIADNAAGAAVESEVHSCRALDYRQRVELVQLSVQQRRLDAVNIAWQHAHYWKLSLSALRRTHSTAPRWFLCPSWGGRRQDLRFGPNGRRRQSFHDERNLKLDSSSLSYDFLPVRTFTAHGGWP